jgi:catechol 2,3-dioxygenase-like lactoylglutathione lyase family enzyme
MSFSDKEALIIGGGSGMGLEAAKLLVHAGASVTLVGRRHEKVKWLSGVEYVKRFDYPGDRLFTKSFARSAGRACRFSTKAARSYLFQQAPSILRQAFFLDTISSGEIGPPGMKRESPHQEARDSWNEHTHTNHSTRSATPAAEFNRQERAADNERWQMKIKRIVSNIKTSDVKKAHIFYHDVLGLELVMDHGWIRTYGSDSKMTVQVSFASEGGSGTPVPDLSIEVDNIETALKRVKKARVPVEYGPESKPWEVRRFYVRDPFGNLINILQHE